MKILENDFDSILYYIDDVESFRNTNWLLTGATGMIGSYLLSFLIYLNESRLDSSMHFTVVHRGNINSAQYTMGQFMNKSCVTFLSLDLSLPFRIDQIDKFDFVIHGASNAIPQVYLQYPIQTIQVNVNATQTFLEQLKESSNLKSFLYISSGEIYGQVEVDNIPTQEDYCGRTDHLNIRSCYVESKRFAETLCRTYGTSYGIPVKMIRPIHVYGPGFKQQDTRVWADFIFKTLKGEDIVILGDGLARRGFCYLSDAVIQIMAVLTKGNNGEVYNIGNDKHVSIKELAEAVALQSNRKIKIIIKNNLPEYLKDSPNISCPDITKVRMLIDKQNIDVSEGLRRTIEWMKEREGVML
ncbi:MAG: NAD-dependent epimerase/dehydratase family protein [Sporomusaceae bacterium]|nr:NAD-dependent epimerase/dehydratase family protein [Sporomusaceae bacterium]